MNPSRIVRNSADLSKSIAYSTNLLRASDSDSFFTYLFQQQSNRHAYLVLKCLNIELANINDSVSNKAIGKLKFNWWRDAINSTFKVSRTLLLLCPKLSVHLRLYKGTLLCNVSDPEHVTPG